MSISTTSIAKTLVKQITAPPSISRERTLLLSELLSAGTHLVSSAEYLAASDDRLPGGLNDWQVAREGYLFLPPTLIRFVDLISTPNATRRIHLARLAAGSTLLIPHTGRYRGAVDIGLALSAAALYPRNHFGTDGSDQTSFLVQLTVGLARLSRSPSVQDTLIWYVAQQSTLSYAVSGWVKLLSPTWRSGAALSGIMRTHTYGHRAVWQLAHDHPSAARALVRGVLAMESLFPFVYAANGRLTRTFLASAALFHAANGPAMGLGRFATAFIAMHPAVAYTTAPRSTPAGRARDDTAPRATAVVLAAVAAAGLVGDRIRRRRIDKAAEGLDTLTSRSGNVLRYRVHPGPDTADTVVILVHGLGVTSSYFSWLARNLSTSHTTITYDRSAYTTATAAPTPATDVDDLLDLITAATKPHQRVVLAGHSLGGYVAYLAAQQHPDRFSGVVYLDTSHPGEIAQAHRENDGIATALRLVPHTMRLGLGWLMRTPRWVEQLPAPERRAARDRQRDGRVWIAAQREWTAAAHHATRDSDLRPSPCPVLVLSARRSIELNPKTSELHNEIAASYGSTSATTTVIEDADHETILTDPVNAATVGSKIREFIHASANEIEAP